MRLQHIHGFRKSVGLHVQQEYFRCFLRSFQPLTHRPDGGDGAAWVECNGVRYESVRAPGLKAEGSQHGLGEILEIIWDTFQPFMALFASSLTPFQTLITTWEVPDHVLQLGWQVYEIGDSDGPLRTVQAFAGLNAPAP